MKQRLKTILMSESMVLALWGVVCLCVVATGAYVMKYQGFWGTRAQLDPNQLKHTDPNEAELKQLVAKAEDKVKAFQGENLFVKTPPKQNPVNQVNIIGHEALINGQLYKVGDKVGDATVVAITPETVTVEWNGTKTTYSPLNGQSKGGDRPSPSRPAPRDMKTAAHISPNSEPAVQKAHPATPVKSVVLGPEQMEKLNRMPPEVRASLKARGIVIQIQD